MGGELFEKNEEYGLVVHDTGGNAFFGKAGVEINYRTLALGITTLLPIVQDLNGGKVEVKNRFSVYLNINIPKNNTKSKQQFPQFGHFSK
jgi:hypothetical protein